MPSPEMDTSAKSYAVKQNKANIYVYRNEVFGAAVKLGVLVDGRAVGDTASKTFLLLEVDPGSHTIVSKSENDATLKCGRCRRTQLLRLAGSEDGAVAA